MLTILHHPICNDLQHMIVSHLQSLIVLDVIYNDVSNQEIFIKFLENSGKNLGKGYIDESINLSIVQCCSNLKNLVIIIKKMNWMN